MPLFKTILNDKAVYHIPGGNIEINGVIWSVVGLDKAKGKWVYTLKNGDRMEERTENQLLEIHKKHGIAISVMTLSEALK